MRFSEAEMQFPRHPFRMTGEYFGNPYRLAYGFIRSDQRV